MPVFAQAIDTKIFFSGAEPYTQKDLATVLGLHAGQLFNDNEVQAASQRLVDTGLFESVAMTGSGAGSARQIRFTIKVTPDEKLLKPSFANFVWFTPDELDRNLRSRVPLYRGLLPDSGNLSDSIGDALTAMLKEKGINALISHAIVEPTTQHPVRAVSFQIDSPTVTLTSFDLQTDPPLTGADTKDAKIAIYKVMMKAANKPYLEGIVGDTSEDRILAGPQSLGYADAKLVSVKKAIASKGAGYDVSLAGTLALGDTYRLDTLRWTSTALYSEADLKRDASLHSGDLATGTALLKTEDAILDTYRAQGYIDAYLQVNRSLDNALHTVSYDISVVPGEPYHLHAVMLAGPDPKAVQAFHDSWKMHSGDLYSPVYVVSYLKSHAAQPEFSASLMSYMASANPDTHLVDLTITFVPNPHSR
jgi:outer membrane protein insertion porin family